MMAKQISEQYQPGIPLKIFITIFCILCISLFFFLAWISQIFDLSLPELVVEFKNMLFYPNMNLFVVGEISGKNVLKLFYYFAIFGIFFLGIYFMLFVYNANQPQKISFLQILSLTGFLLVFLFSGTQQIHRFEHFNNEQKSLRGKDTDGKNTVIFGGLYQFPHLSQNALNKRYRGEFITDYNLSQSPYMFHHRALSYHFYPKVSLRFDNQTPDDVLFLYHKQNPLEHIPDNYKIVMESNDRNFILAIKDRP